MIDQSYYAMPEKRQNRSSKNQDSIRQMVEKSKILSFRFFSLQICVLILMSLMVQVQSVWARVGGELQSLYQQKRVFGGISVTGNSLMQNSLVNPLVNSSLLAQSSGDLRNIPFDAQIEGAYLFWTGSAANQADQTADLTLSDGSFLNDIRADRCFTQNIPQLNFFFYCRADITNQLALRPGAMRYNGRYSVGDIQAQPGQLDRNGQCIAQDCQAKYGAWSLVVIYSSQSSTTLRDIVLYDGFLSLDETTDATGIQPFNIQDIDFPSNGRAQVSFLGLEGDALLGVPPQDTEPNPQLRCATCFDFFEINGTKLSDANNPANNIFNSSSTIGTTLGVDLDQFDISSYIMPGSRQIAIRVGSGDGRFDPSQPDPTGGGELFFLGYMAFAIDRNAPRFTADGNRLDVVPDQAAPLERVVFTWRIANQGSLTAQAVTATLALPQGLSYFPGSFRVDNVDPIPGNEAQNPLQNGYQIGNITFQGDQDRVLTWRASLNQGLAPGTRLISQGRLSASNLPEALLSNEAIVTVLGAVPIGNFTKEVFDGNGNGQFEPGENIEYRIKIQNPSPIQAINALRFKDQLPPYLQLLNVSGPGTSASILAQNLVDLQEISIPPANGNTPSEISISISARIHTVDELQADGVSMLDGFVIENQANADANGMQRLSDDPNTVASSDSTKFALSVAVDINSNSTRKEVVDLNGGQLEPGDELRYTIRIRNQGQQGGTIRINDRLPAFLENCVIESPPEARCENGSVVADLFVDASELSRVVFRVKVSANAPNGTAIQNAANLSVVEDPTQVLTVTSPLLIVVNTPELVVQKTAISGPTVAIAGEIEYELAIRNIGNQTAFAIQLKDLINYEITAFNFTQNPNNLATYDPNTKTLSVLNGQLPRQEEWIIRFKVQISNRLTSMTLLSNQASVQYQINDPQSNPANAQNTISILSDDPTTALAKDPSIVTVQGNGAQIALIKQSSVASVNPADVLSYRITVSNIGTQAVENIVITDRLPDVFSQVQAINGQISVDQVITWDQSQVPQLGNLDVGQSVTLEINATVKNDLPAIAFFDNQAQARANNLMTQVLSDDPSTEILQDPTRVQINEQAQLKMEKRVIDLNGGTFERNDQIRYEISVIWQKGNLSDLSLIDPIPNGLTDIVPLDGGLREGQNLRWNILALNETQNIAVFRFEAKISAQAMIDTQISNQASINVPNFNLLVLSDDPNTNQVDDPTIFTVTAPPQIQIKKTVTPSTAKPSEQVQWLIEVSNTGSSALQNLSLVDLVPRGLENIEVIGGQESNGQITWNIVSLGSNQRQRFEFKATVQSTLAPSDLTTGNQILNQATITTQMQMFVSDDPSTPASNDPTALLIDFSPNLVFTKTVEDLNGGNFQAGEQVRYQIKVVNQGQSLVNGLVLTDTFAPEIENLTTVDAQINGQTLTWNKENLAAGETWTVIVDAQLSASLQNGKKIENQASLEAVEIGTNGPKLSDDPSTAELDDPTMLQIIQGVDLSFFQKTVEALDTPAFLAGGRVRYRLEIRNVGMENAINVQITDIFPDFLENLTALEGNAIDQGWQWILPTLNAGESRILVVDAVIKSDVDIDTLIENQATLIADGIVEGIESDDPTTTLKDATGFKVQGRGTLSLQKTVKGLDENNQTSLFFKPGQKVEYELRLINQGLTVSNVDTVVDQVTNLLENIEILPTSHQFENIQVNQNQINWPVAPLNPNESWVLSFRASIATSVTNGQIIENQASILSSGQLSDDPNTLEANDATKFEINLVDQVTFQKTATGPFFAGTAYQYQIKVQNNSTAALRGLRITDQLDPRLTLVSAEPPVTSNEQGKLTWQFDQLGTSTDTDTGIITILLTVTGNAGANGDLQISNQAQLVAENTPALLSDDPNTMTLNDPTIITLISGPRLQLTKSVQDVNGGNAQSGDQLVYTLKIENQGNEAARNLQIIDPVSLSLSNITAVGGNFAGGIASWNVPLIDAGQSISFALNASILETVVDGDIISNQFAVRQENGEQLLSNSVDLTVQSTKFTFTKTVQPVAATDFVPNGLVEYTLVLKNEGTTPITNIEIKDQVDPNLVGVQTTNAQINNQNGTLITWNSSADPQFAILNGGASLSVTFRGQISDTSTDQTIISNQANFTASLNGLSVNQVSDDPGTPQAEDPTSFTVKSGASFAITKQLIGDRNRLLGANIQYIIELKNTGTVAATLLKLIDLVDARLQITSITRDGISLSPAEIIALNQSNQGYVIDQIQSNQSIRFEMNCTLINGNQGERVENQAFILVKQENGNEISIPSDDPSTDVINDPTVFNIGLMGREDLTLVKIYQTTNGSDIAYLNEEISWQIVLKNQSANTLFNLNVEDLLPENAAYVAESLRVNDQLVTDLTDTDQGQVINQQIQVKVSQVDAGQSVKISFKTKALRGEQVINQASINTGDKQLLSDNNNDLTDGINPTVVKLAQQEAKAFKIETQVDDINGPPAVIVDLIDFQTKIFNIGALDLNQLHYQGILQKGLNLKEILYYPIDENGALSNPLPVVYRQTDLPNADGNGAVWQSFEWDLNIEQKKAGQIVLKLQIDRNLTEDQKLCMTSVVTEKSLPVDKQSQRQEQCVEAKVLYGALKGIVYQNTNAGQADQYDVGKDLPLSDLIVSLWEKGAQSGTAETVDFSKEDGQYVLRNVRPGQYWLRVKTSNGTELKKLEINMQTTAQKLDLPILLSGRIYDSQEGQMIENAQIFVYEDLDDDDDPFDIESAQKKRLVNPDQFSSATQQGQKTPKGGFYFFDFKDSMQGKRYLLEVIPPGGSMVYPSSFQLSMPSFLRSTSAELKGNDSILPDATTKEVKYYLAFELAQNKQSLINNHIPLDPLTSLIEISKKSRKMEYRTGEIVTYEIDIINRSTKSLVYDPIRRTGGIYLDDILPKGLKYVKNSASWISIQFGREMPLFSANPSGIELLRFGKEETSNNSDSLAISQIPMDLKAGESLRLRYQAVIGVNAKPLQKYNNRAFVMLEGNTQISKVAQAEIRIIADADFDQSIILGKVWCDANENGEQEENERGLAGAQIFSDSGTYAITDSAGQYHLQQIDAGMRAFKLNLGSLMPGAKVTTDLVRTMYLTRGLPAKLDFGVTCPSESKDDASVLLGKESLEEALKKIKAQVIWLKGNVNDPSLKVEGFQLTTDLPELKLWHENQKAEKIDIPTTQEGQLLSDLQFDIQIPKSINGISQWALFVSTVGGSEKLVLSGLDLPPERLLWDGTDELGNRVIEPGQIHHARLLLKVDQLGSISSAILRFAVGLFSYHVTEPIVILGMDYFENEKLTQMDEQGLIQASQLIEKHPSYLEQKGNQRLILELHSSGEKNMINSSRRLDQIAAFLSERLKVDQSSFVLKNMKNDLPLRPNVSLRNRQINRRLVIRPYQLSKKDDALLKQSVKEPPIVRVNRDQVQPKENGDFSMITQRPSHGVLEVYLRAENGAQSTFVIPVSAGQIDRDQSKLKVDQSESQTLLVAGTLPSLSIGGQVISTDDFEIELKGVQPESEKNYEIEWTTQSSLKSRIVQWQFVIQNAQKEIVFEQKGNQSDLPSRFLWLPLEASPGIYQAIFRAVDRDGIQLQSSVLRLSLQAGGLIQQQDQIDVDWKIQINGREIQVAADQKVEQTLPIKTLDPIDVRIRTRQGGLIKMLMQGQSSASSASSASSTSSTSSASPSQSQSIESIITELNQSPIYSSHGTRWTYAPYVPPINSNLKGVDQSSSKSTQATFGRDVLLKAATPFLMHYLDQISAKDLKVEIPKGTELDLPAVSVSGQTKPGNRIYLNGEEIVVGKDGKFAGLAQLSDDGRLEVKSVDEKGNSAIIEKQYQLKNLSWFLLALGESTTGMQGNELDGIQPHTSTQVGDQLYVHGRAALYLKGRMKGDQVLNGLFKKYEFTVHADTSKQQSFEPQFRQMIDPEGLYPVYGDSSTEIRDVNTRGPLYVLVRADQSLFTVGNFKSQVRGIELINYDRTLYGAMADFKVEKDDWQHEMKVFAATQNQPQKHAYVELRGTGGSLYYLPHRELVAGSERVYLIERDKITNMERRRKSLSRDIDYNIRYPDGRILMKTPVNITTMDTIGALPQPYGATSTLDGHPVFVSIEYDHLDRSQRGEDAWGVYGRETWKKKISVGGGYLQEGRNQVGARHYRLWGAELKFKHQRKTGVDIELAKSQSVNAENLFSQDGGITFEGFNRRDGSQAQGKAFLIRGGLELDDLIGNGDKDRTYAEGYWRMADAGYYAGGNLQQQGMENYGVSVQHWLNERHSLKFQYDHIASIRPSEEKRPFFQDIKRDVTRISHLYKHQKWTVTTGFVSTESKMGNASSQSSLAITGAGALGATNALNGTNGTGVYQNPLYKSKAVTSAIQYQFSDRLTLLAEQEVVLAGDRRYFNETTDLFVTSVGMRYQVSQQLQLEAIESIRWSGDNATQIGARTDMDDQRTMYAQYRVLDQMQQQSNTSVVGAEERWGKGGRAYSEYQLENGQLGQRNRAVVGIGKRTQIMSGLSLDVAYQRNQVISENASSGAFGQNALSFAVEWLSREDLKLSTRFEVRNEDNDESFGRRDKNQFLTMNAFSYKVHPDLTLLMRFNYSYTTDLILKDTEAEFMETSLGAAYRPLKKKWLILLAKVAKRYEQRPVDLLIEQPEQEESDVLSVIPIIELPWKLQLVEKFAYRRSALRVQNTPAAIAYQFLWINRLNYHLTNSWDFGIEYRVLHNTLAQNWRHGAVVELSYIIKQAIRVGAGYNFSSVSDDEFARLNERFGGPFIRVMAQY